MFNLKIGDYLFTEFNIFEKIETMIVIKEKVKVFNLEVNSIYNYFANSYLIHNGAPCSACKECGLLDSFDFTPPGETVSQKFVCQSWTKSIPFNNRATIQATFREVFEP